MGKAINIIFKDVYDKKPKKHMNKIISITITAILIFASVNVKALKLSIEDNPFQFSGEYHDVESAMYYQRARYYDPDIMSFISRDSIDAMNRYGYCEGDPVNKTDPSGNFSIGGTL